MKKNLTQAIFVLFFLAINLIASKTAKACFAQFTYTNACAGDTVFFNALDLNAVYTWDFGDTNSGVFNVSHDTDTYHVFVNPGTYYVSLFVNTGAMWDFQTEIITIGTDCFNADFSSYCNQVHNTEFTNHSVGDNLSYTWYFGDPLSGALDTSTIENPVHIYQVSGFYTVTLIISDGIQSDTTTQHIYAGPDCFSVELENYLGSYCVQETVQFNPHLIGNPTSFEWNFGDPASGPLNSQPIQFGYHNYSAPGIYLATLIASNGVQSETYSLVISVNDCNVLPGNTNFDGEVNGDDLFALGMYFGSAGTVRANASQAWVSQNSDDWSTSGYQKMFLQDLVDKKHADCNGDGVVDLLDLNAIQLNYGNHVAGYFKNDKMLPMRTYSVDPTLVLNTSSGTFNQGDTIQMEIQLNGGPAVDSIYGLSAKIYYDPAQLVPGSIAIDFSNSEMGQINSDLLAISKDNSIDGSFDFAFVRTGGNRVHADGTIGKLSAVLRSTATGSADFSFDAEAKLISNKFPQNNYNSLQFLPVQVASTSINILSTSVKSNVHNDLTIYPNPANEKLFVKMEDADQIQKLELSNAIGENCQSILIDRSTQDQLEMDLSKLPSGVYFLHLQTKDSSIIERIFIDK